MDQSFSFYLSPEVPRWAPASESELAEGLEGGLLSESHFLDFKKMISDGRGANRELARDLVQFALDGGLLIVGVEETDDGPVLVPQQLTGLSERVEQVARSIPEPPLAVDCHPIRTDADPSMGYLLISVPPSGLAPHMVDGTYFGRGDKTKIRLSNDEILRLHARQQENASSMARLLDECIARDPVPTEQRRQAHLFIAARPVAPRRDMALPLVSGQNWWARLREVVEAGVNSGSFRRDAFSPSLESAINGDVAQRPDGVALTRNMAPDRRMQPGTTSSWEDAVEIEVSDLGEIRIFMGRLSDTTRSGVEVLFVEAMPLFVRQAVQVAASLARRTGYLGPWQIGVAATAIAGLRDSDEDVWRTPVAYSSTDSEYRSETSASTAELLEAPGRVTARLVGRFLRAMGAEKRCEALLSDG